VFPTFPFTEKANEFNQKMVCRKRKKILQFEECRKWQQYQQHVYSQQQSQYYENEKENVSTRENIRLISKIKQMRERKREIYVFP
jgi:hypothetical protein